MKKFLLLTYYFPPCGGAGVQRWLRLLKYLPSNGWQPTIITTENGDYPVRDESLLEQIPKEVKVIRTKTPSFGNLFRSILGRNEKLPYGSLNTSESDNFAKKILYWLRLNVVIPDARVIWNKFCHRAALEELMSDKYELVVTTGPPHSTHLVGMKIHNDNKMKWITDFRDPWTKIYYLKLTEQNQAAQAINRKLERKVVGNADLNLVISHYISEHLPEGRKKVFLNGFDPDDFKDLSYKRESVFRIKYIGKLTEGQDIRPVFHSLSEMATRNKGITIEFSFIGTFEQIPREIQSYEIESRNIPYVSHREALWETVNAELLILLINDYEGNEGMLTTKLFEYLGSRIPILCIGPKHGAAAEIITEYKAGVVCDYGDTQAVDYAISYYYDRWAEGKELLNPEDISELSAPVQAKRLASIFNSL